MGFSDEEPVQECVSTGSMTTPTVASLATNPASAPKKSPAGAPLVAEGLEIAATPSLPVGIPSSSATPAESPGMFPSSGSPPIPSPASLSPDSAAQGPSSDESSASGLNAVRDGINKSKENQYKANSTEMSSKLAKLGLAAVLAYGLCDAVTYTSFFVLAFLGYKKSTGNNPAATMKALLGVVNA
ncbi:hypothetical protein ACFX15_029507 [Malus domestica]